MVLQTKRLFLRPWEEADAESLYEYAADPAVGPAAGWPAHTSVENSRQIIRDVLAAPETYAIVLKKTELPVGSIGLHFHSEFAEKDNEVELGYWLGVPYWGQGIVPEAAREMLRHAFEDLDVPTVWCGYFDGNEKSKRVQEKCGFRYQRTIGNADVPQMGERRTCHVSRLTREQWLRGDARIQNEAEQTVLETERLFLRRLRQSDFDSLCRTMQDEKAMYAYEGAFTDVEVQEWLDRQLLRYRKWGFGLWAVILRETGEMIGQCGLTMQPWKEDEVLEIGYLLERKYWHKGYALEAASACREYAFDILKADSVCSIIRDTNAASRNVAVRNGMKKEDAWVKHYRDVDMPHDLYVVHREPSDRVPAAQTKRNRKTTDNSKGASE